MKLIPSITSHTSPTVVTGIVAKLLNDSCYGLSQGNLHSGISEPHEAKTI